MAHYSEDIVNEVFQENDIVDYISGYVTLKKSGRDYSGLCPFHKEKTPSFHVSGEKQLFHCFGCGASGNLVQFVMRAEGIDFVEALKLLADRAGIVLPEDDNRIDSKLHEKRKKIYEMNKAAARFYFKTLTQAPEGKAALDYFKKRRLLAKTVKNYGLGFAPDDYNALRSYMNGLGYKDDELLEAGLLSQKDGRYYDRFRNRVIFPIIDLRGNVIGFGGRIMNSEPDQNGYKPPKYLNSAETPVFNKGKNLFSLNLAKKDSHEKLILVEGYMDVISVYQAGVTNVVATLGTALTEDQAKLMLKYCSEILICYDTDEAGRKATLRAIDIIAGAGGRSKVIHLKGAKDPDEYIKTMGTEMFLRAVEEATPSTEYRLTLAKTEYNLDVAEGKIRFVNEAAEILSGINDAVEVDEYVKKVSRETEISKDAIYAEYKKYKKKNAGKNQTRRIVVRESKTKTDPLIGQVQDNVLEKAQKKLLNLIIQNKKLWQKTAESLSPDDFSNPVYKKLAEKIYKSYLEGKTVEPSILLNEFDGEDVNTASEVFYNMEVYEDNEKTLTELIISIKKEKIKQQILTEKDPNKINQLLKEQAMLTKK